MFATSQQLNINKGEKILHFGEFNQLSFGQFKRRQQSDKQLEKKNFEHFADRKVKILRFVSSMTNFYKLHSLC